MSTILLDSGHGGRDSGAVGFHAVEEKDVNLYMTHLIAAHVHWLSRGEVQIIFTRSQDEHMLLRERSGRERDLEPNLFVSVHANAAEVESASGFEVLYYSEWSRGLTVAKCIRDEVEKEFPLHGDGLVKRSDLHVLRYTNAPAVLVENLFLSNLSDLKMLTDTAKSNDLARCVATGIWNSRRVWI